jgi:serine/threonine protein kinase
VARLPIQARPDAMENAEYHLHNEVGIRFPPLKPAFTEGELFFGRFRALISRTTGMSVLGEGGTGRIHLVRDELMDREVALKIPLDSIMRDGSAREDVIHETRQAMDLTHPNIVRIHDFHEAERLWGISMQCVRGKNIDEWRFQDAVTSGSRRSIRPIPVDTIRDWIAQLCDALRYAHEDARMVHRDIKPKNLMLERREGGEKLLITDFGITQRLRQHTMLLSLDHGRADKKDNMGTLPYMPWEQIAGGRACPLDDIYAVGASIYDLITGRPPFYEGGFDQIKIQIKETIPPSMEQRLADFGIPAPDVPYDWEQAVAACLSKRPEDRPQSMRELARALGFQSGSDTALEARVQTQNGRIRELEEKLESITLQNVTRTADLSRIAEWENELNEARQRQREAEERAQEVEAQKVALAVKLDYAEQQIKDAGKSDDERLTRLRDASEKRISEMEHAHEQLRLAGEAQQRVAVAEAEAEIERLRKQLDQVTDQAEQEAKARVAELEAQLENVRREAASSVDLASREARNRLDELQGRLRQVEEERERAIASVREESENRIKKQESELRKIQDRLQREVAQKEILEKAAHQVKNKQAASMTPLLASIAIAIMIGLGSGLIYHRSKQTARVDAQWVAKEYPDADVSKAPGQLVTWGQFRTFATDLGFEPEKLIADGAKNQDVRAPVSGVSWTVAQRYCEWLSDKRADGYHYVIPSITELQDDKWTWSSTVATAGGVDQAQNFIGFVIHNDNGDRIELPPTMALENTRFRVMRKEKPKKR